MAYGETPFSRRRALFIAAVALIAAFFLWRIPQLEPFMYPFRLFVTFVHESGHGLAGLFSGGRFEYFEIYANGAGQARIAGGNLLLILPAGYLGAAFFGALLFYLTNSLRYSRTISRVLGVVIILISVLFARGPALQPPIALFVGVLSGVLLFFIGMKGSRDLNIFALNLLAMLTSLNAVFDIVYLVQNSAAMAGSGNIRNDAAALATQVPLVPAAVWAALWVICALIMLGMAIYFSIVRPVRRGEL